MILTPPPPRKHAFVLRRFKQVSRLLSFALGNDIMGTLKPVFRTDIEARPTDKPGSQGPTYIIRDPINGERFEFSEKDYFLCTCMDGRHGEEAIAAKFSDRFGQELPPGYLAKLINQLTSLHLLQSPPEAPSHVLPEGTHMLSLDEEDDEGMEEGSADDQKRYAFWPWCNPSSFFEQAARVTGRFHFIFRILAFSLLLLVPAALYLLYIHRDLLYYDMSLNVLGFGFLGRIMAVIVLVDLLRCFVTGTVGTYVGARVTEFGLRLRFGVIPRLYVRRVGRNQLERSNRLWAYGAAFLVRFILIVTGTMLWYLFRATALQLANWGILILHAGIIGFILLAVPFRISDGYRWITTFFNLPGNLIQLAFFSLSRIVTRRPLPTSLSKDKGFLIRLILYALALVVIWTFFAIKVLTRISQGLASAFPEIFGRATDIITLGIVVFLVGRWALAKVTRKRRLEQSGTPSPVPEPDAQQSYTKWVVGILIALCIPLPFRPGGSIELLPPRQLDITTPLAGRITDVLYAGGDGRVLEQGTVVARITSDELLHEVEKTREHIVRQEAEISRLTALLNKLQQGARTEEIARAEASLQRVGEEVSVATLQLRSAEVSASFSQRRMEMLQTLYDEGVYSQLEFDQARRQAEIDAIASQTAKHVVDARKAARREALAQLNQLQAGARQEEVEAALAELDAAHSAKRNFEQQLLFLENKLLQADLVMPLTGYIREGFLHQKIGRYLQAGATYAMAQSEEEVILLMDVPEYDGVHIREGQTVHVRLFAFPINSLQGEVIRVEPSPSHREGNRVFRVETLVSKEDVPWRPGITGYAKVHVGWKPLGLILLRPLVRFFQVELWSWLP